MFRGVGELFRVLLPPFNNFPGHFEQTALGAVSGRKHPESLILLNLTAAEPLHLLLPALFIPDLFRGNGRGIQGIAVFTGHLHHLLEIA